MKEHHDIKPLRIIFSVLLAIISVVFFSNFVYLSTFKAALSKNIFVEVFSNVDLFDVQMGDIANELNIEGVNADSTVSETMAAVISDTAKEEFNYDISRESVEEILDDPKLREDLGNITGDLLGGVIYGSLDSDKLADDVEELIVDNKDTIEDLSGYKISDELINDVHDKVAELEVNGGILEDGNGESGFTYINNIVKDSVIYFFLGGGILCVIGIMLLNMFKLPTGFRTNGIAFIVNGIFTLLAGLLVRYSPIVLFKAITGMLSINGYNNNYGIIDNLLDTYAANLGKHILVPGTIFLVLGIVCMITQGVLLSTSRNK